MKFLLLQKAITSCQIKMKRKQAQRYFIFSQYLAKIQVTKLIMQPQQYCIYIISKIISLLSKLCVLQCTEENNFPTALWPLTQQV